MIKKFFILVGLLAFSLGGYAQFILTPDGLVSPEDETRYYIVYETKGLKQRYLYSRILPFVKRYFSNPEDHIIEEEYKQILVEGKGIAKIGTGPIKGHILYRLSIGMQDDKLGYEVQELDFTNANLVEPATNVDTSKAPISNWYHIFDRNGNLHEPELKKQVEDYFNDIVYRINSYIDKTSDVDWDL